MPCGGREEDGAGGRRGPALAEAEQEAPRAVESGGDLRGARRQAELAGVAGVDAADQRVDQPIQHLRAEAVLDERAEVVGRGVAAPHERLERRPRLARPAEQAGAGQRAEAGRHPQHQPVRDGVQRAVPPDVGPAGRGRDQVVEAELVGEVDGPGHPGQEGVGALVDRGQAGEGRGADLAAEPLVGLEQRDPWRSAALAGAARRRRRVSPVMPPPTTATWVTGRRAGSRGRPGAPSTDGSSFTQRRAGEGQAAGSRPAGAGLDVEVVEHLEVVGHEAAGAHEHAGRALGGGQVVDDGAACPGPIHGSGVRPADCQAMPPRPPTTASPAGAATASAVARSSSG